MPALPSFVESARTERKRDAESPFTESEAEYLAENFLGRLATASSSGQPHVVPVAYRFNGKDIYFGGWNLAKSLKFRNLVANDRVAIVVDQVVSTSPWRVKGVEVRGRAHSEAAEGGATVVRITPRSVRSWGLGVK